MQLTKTEPCRVFYENYLTGKREYLSTLYDGAARFSVAAAQQEVEINNQGPCEYGKWNYYTISDVAEKELEAI